MTIRISLSSAAITRLGCNICYRGISLTKSRAFFNYALRVVCFSPKSALSEHRRRSLRNWQNGILFLVLGL